MMPSLEGLHLTIDGWQEGRKKYLYKTKSQPRVRMKVWEWEHDNWLEENELEALILDKNEASTEWLNLESRLIEGIAQLTLD